MQNPLDAAWRDPLEVTEFPTLNSEPRVKAQAPLQQGFSAEPESAAQPQPKGIFQKVLDAGTKVSNALGFGGTTEYLGKVGANLAHPKLGAQGYIAQPNLKEAVGAGLQLGSLAIPGKAASAAPGIVRAATAGAATGAASSGGQALADNQSLLKAGEQALQGGTIGGAFGGGMATLGRFLERTGDKIQYSVLKPVTADLEDGFSLDTIKKYNLGGSLNQVFRKTETRMDDLTKQLNAKLRASDKSINLNEAIRRTTERLAKEKLSTFGSNDSMSSALDWLGKESLHIGRDISIPEANIVKRAVGHYGAWTHGIMDPETTARQKVANVFYNELKKEIETLSPEGVEALNKEMSELIPVLNAVLRRIPIAERNNALSLTDIIGLVGSAVEPRALGVTLLNLISKSGVVGNALSRLGGKTVKGATPLGALIGAVNLSEPDYASTTQ